MPPKGANGDKKSKAIPPELVASARAFLVRLAREELAGMNQTDAGALFGLAQGSYSAVISGDSDIGGRLLVAIADYANRPIDSILNRPGAALAVALEYHRDVDVPPELVRRLRATVKGDKTPKQWWEIVEKALRERPAGGAAAEVTRGFGDYEKPSASPPRQRKAR
jgi:transcriptional regulator with XRE-family HTH domain